MDWPEVMFRAIERIGFPIVMALFLAWALYKLWLRGELITKTHIDAIQAHSEQIKQISRESNAALDRNTQVTREQRDATTDALEATQELTKTIKEKLGSDPTGICRFQKFLEDGGFRCSAEEVKVLFREYERRRKEQGGAEDKV